MKRAMLFVVMLVAFLVIFRFASGGHGLPPMFKEGLTLDQAIERAEQNKRSVLVMASASWCPPCQQMKQGTLLDDDVERFVAERFEPVFLDVSNASSPGVKDARRFSFEGVPTFVIVRPSGEVAAQVSGAMGAADFLEFLRAAAS